MCSTCASLYPFKAVDYSQVSDGERIPIETYAEGIRLTDQATADFLNALNGLDKPVTVVFYGDHINELQLSSRAKQLLADYRLVQYDMTVGKDYLTQFGFTDLPK